MNEDALQFAWKFKLIKPGNFFTTSRIPFEITATGEHNHNAGPDFINARIKLGNAYWAGSVEVHWKSSDWFAHGHHTNRDYNNVILHVVYEHDQEVYDSQGRIIMCLEIKSHLQDGFLESCRWLGIPRKGLPCGKLFGLCAPFQREKWLERMLLARLEHKFSLISELYKWTKNNLEETYYLLLCRNFGFHVNAEPFFQLGKSIPLRILLSCANDTTAKEALLFGQAGMLDRSFKDTYPNELIRSYQFLRRKHSLLPPIPHTWKFLRLHPGNFPYIRIAQFAAFISFYQHSLSKFLTSDSPGEIISLFRVSASPYWDTHFYFERESKAQKKTLGTGSIENILVNTLLPLRFFYGKVSSDARYCNQAIEWYYVLKPENNRVTRLFASNNFKAGHAAHSQSLWQLFNDYCSGKKCLSCAIGIESLKQKN